MVARTVLAGSLALGVLAGCGGDVPAEPVDANDARTRTTASGAAAQDPARAAVRRGTVAYVSDGDTIGVRVAGGVERVRLLGIDAPETTDPDAPVGCFGLQAAAAARTLLQRRSTVTLVTDPSQDTRDRFGRLLAYVFRDGERLPVNQRLLEIGAARVYVFRNRPFLRLPAFRAAETRARASGRGLWSRCP